MSGEKNKRWDIKSIYYFLGLIGKLIHSFAISISKYRMLSAQQIYTLGSEISTVFLNRERINHVKNKLFFYFAHCAKVTKQCHN